jgi:hypothetical protein
MSEVSFNYVPSSVEFQKISNGFAARDVAQLIHHNETFISGLLCVVAIRRPWPSARRARRGLRAKTTW